MKNLKTYLLSILLLFTGCAKLGYLTEQGIQQVRIQWNGVDNDKILKDPDISQEKKEKIMLVEEYKKFFYHYFDSKPTDIYSKTTMLDDEAVTYLVIAGPHTKIEAHEFSFPFMGSFPYIGFFKLKSAKKFAEELEEDQKLVTWIRPVYAYSTLGYLEDRILSSFFEYDDIELAELIFHELFHTIFFIKDEVELNENLANLYGKELLKEYFKGRTDLEDYLGKEGKREILNKRIVELISVLQNEFNKLGVFLNNEKADELTERFIEEVFKPELRVLAAKLGLTEKDFKIEKKWNQARFAAFLTYEEEQSFLEELQKSKKLNLKDFLSWLKIEYKSYKAQKEIESFTDYLKQKVPHAPVAVDRSH